MPLAVACTVWKVTAPVAATPGMPPDQITGVAGYPRGFGERSHSEGLHDPEIGARRPRQTKGIVERPLVDSDHDDTMPSNPPSPSPVRTKRGVVPHVAQREVHCAGPPQSGQYGRCASLRPIVATTRHRQAARPEQASAVEKLGPNLTSRRASRPSSTVHTVPRPCLRFSDRGRTAPISPARQHAGSDHDFRLFGEMNVIRHLVEGDIDQPFFVDCVALYLDPRRRDPEIGCLRVERSMISAG